MAGSDSSAARHAAAEARATLDLLQSHRSIRRFRNEPVPDADLRAAVAAGQAASTSSAIQAYCAIRVRDASALERLVELTGDQTKVARCGAFLVICGDVRRHRLACAAHGHAYDAHLEGFLLAAIDATLFAQNLVVALEAMGYGICYIGGLRNRLPDVDALLELPEGVYPLYGLCVGVPDETPLPRPRLPTDAVLFDERYPDDESMRTTLDAYDADYRAYLESRGADPRGWTAAMAKMFAHPGRPGIAAYYESKGANLQ